MKDEVVSPLVIRPMKRIKVIDSALLIRYSYMTPPVAPHDFRRLSSARSACELGQASI